MRINDLVRLGPKHVQHIFSEQLYLRTGIDITQPVTFYGIINERCNVKCQHCGYWRLEDYQQELSTQQWQNTLLNLKKLVGNFSINFSGGEPFLRSDMIDLLNFCHQQGIRSGVTTNGSTLTRNNVKKIVATHPFNINISCDAPNSEIHDEFRGFAGLFNKLNQGIIFLLEEKKLQHIEFPIVIKSTINALNLHLLEELVNWTQEIGATAIHFQPLERWTPETFDKLWIEKEHQPELERVINNLIDIKKKGAPILNDEHALSLMLPYFAEEKLSSNQTCLTGLRNYFIRTNGDVQLCYLFPAIGNVKENTAQEIWFGKAAQETRKETIRCQKSCLSTCLYQRSLMSKFKHFIKLMDR